MARWTEEPSVIPTSDILAPSSYRTDPYTMDRDGRVEKVLIDPAKTFTSNLILWFSGGMLVMR